MKFSLKLADNDQGQMKSPILKAKIPISIFAHAFTSAVTAPTSFSSDLSFSLSTSFESGPSLRLSYTPLPPSSCSSSSSSSSPVSSSSPFSLSLKSGLGLFGSPQNSPLIFSAHFSLSLTKPVIPTFSLHFKPELGHFCLKKTSFSNPKSDPISGSQPDFGAEMDSGSLSNGKITSGIVLDDPIGWQELRLEPRSGNDSLESNCGPLDQKKGKKDVLSSGVSVMARTILPLTKKIGLNLRWGVNFPGNLGSKMPYLTVNKIAIERVEEVEEVEDKKKGGGENDLGELELLKGMCFWMRRDMEVLEKDNKEMKKSLEDIRMDVVLSRNSSEEKVLHFPPTTETSYGGFERWKKSRNGGEEGGEREIMNSTKNRASQVESELERAIKAASISKV